MTIRSTMVDCLERAQLQCYNCKRFSVYSFINMFRLFVAIALVCCLHHVSACSNLLVTPGASSSGASMIAYAADDSTLYGKLYYFPRSSNNPSNATITIYDWDSGAYLGEVKQVKNTFNVVGNQNENQVTIAETTFGGLASLSSQPDAVLDYGNLIYIALQRSLNASHAVQVMGELVAEYGYASTGESFSIADPHEVWVLEMIGKGKNELGAVWVAQKLPDGTICAHANQARIRTFDQSGSADVQYSADVISFAKSQGLYTGTDADFSFSDVYDPLTFSGVRFCEARVYSFFTQYQSSSFETEYLDYVRGTNYTNRMPLYVTPTSTLSLEDLMDAFRNHYENTWFDMTADFGAQPFGSGYRWRPLTWSASDEPDNTYCNERAISTQQTGWSFVAEMRKWMPGVGGLIWFGVDDTSCTVWAPLYTGSDAISSHYGDGSMFGDVMDFDLNSMFFVTNMVANFAYTNWAAMQPELRAQQDTLLQAWQKSTASIDQQLMDMYAAQEYEAAQKLITQATVDAGDTAYDAWWSMYQYLFVKYMDGTVKTAGKNVNPDVKSPGYSDTWYNQIVATTGDHFLVEPDPSEPLYKHIHSVPNDKRNNRKVFG